MASKKEVDIATIDKVKSFLEKVPSKKPTTKPLIEALEELKPAIEIAIERGHTRQEVADMLVEKGIEIKPYHLKNLFAKQRVETPK